MDHRARAVIIAALLSACEPQTHVGPVQTPEGVPCWGVRWGIVRAGRAGTADITRDGQPVASWYFHCLDGAPACTLSPASVGVLGATDGVMYERGRGGLCVKIEGATGDKCLAHHGGLLCEKP